MIVKLENQIELDIQRLPLGKYADLLQALQELPKHLKEFQDVKSMTNDDFLAIAPQLIAKGLPDIIRMIPIATTLTPEQTQELSLNDLIEIIYTVYVVNNYQSVFEKIKKLMAQRGLVNPSTQPS
jgi:hypothetical protein